MRCFFGKKTCCVVGVEIEDAGEGGGVEDLLVGGEEGFYGGFGTRG